MNYTETYNKIYSIFLNAGVNHESSNRAALRIANSVHDIYIYAQKQAPDLLDQVASVIEELSSNIKKVGGYDLDDKNYFNGPTVN